MKTTILIMALSALLCITSCGKKESSTLGEPAAGAVDSTEVDNTATDYPVPVSEMEDTQITVTGSVTGITNGKDGYTAQIKENSGKIYFATISIPNLDDAKQYRQVKEGDSITVTGETWKMGEEEHIKVAGLE